MISCDACNKSYSSIYNLKKHFSRQPLCERWMKLNPVLKDYVDDKFALPMTDQNIKEIDTKCFICDTVFANIGNLNRHLDSSLICSKWSMYKDLEPLQTYIDKNVKYAEFSDKYVPYVSKYEAFGDNSKELQSDYETFIAPAYKLCHIIWNVFLIDKEIAKSDKFGDIINENKIEYMIAILPKGDKVDTELPYHIMEYSGHDMELNITEFDEQCKKIEEYRADRKNIFVFCNNGYQRSIPFLCYYLTIHHANEVPTIERAIDIILPQADKDNYATLRDKYIESMNLLFSENI